MEIQAKFKQIGLIVDKPKQGGGNTNDGNMARRFFKDPSKSAEITENENLIRRLGVILQVISCSYEINVSAFANYVEDKWQLYTNLYPWYYMPISVHKILIHGPEIIKSCILPIGQMSEEALEARNKDCRRYRKYNTRKISRWHTNRDLLSMLLVSSDPIISSLRVSARNKHTTNLCSEVLALLANPSALAVRDKNNVAEATDKNILLSDYSDSD